MVNAERHLWYKREMFIIREPMTFSERGRNKMAKEMNNLFVFSALLGQISEGNKAEKLTF